MTTYRAGLSIAAFVAALMLTFSAGAQQPAGAPQTARVRIAAKATSVPSGFAKHNRNSDTNVGGCQRMPESCSKGWCCP
jgi:hypothetical protein